MKVKDAGHMVPMDQPLNALFILDSLLKQKGFNTHSIEDLVNNFNDHNILITEW